MKFELAKRYVSYVTATALLSSSALLGQTTIAEENPPQFSGKCSNRMHVSSRDWNDVQSRAQSGQSLPMFKDICEVDGQMVFSKDGDRIANGKKVLRILSFERRNGRPVDSLTYQPLPDDYTTAMIVAGTVGVIVVGTTILLVRHKIKKNKAKTAAEQSANEFAGRSKARAKLMAEQAQVPKDVNLSEFGVRGLNGKAQVAGAINKSDVKGNASIFKDRKGREYTTVYANNEPHIVYVYPSGYGYYPFFWDPYLASAWHPGYSYHPYYVDTASGVTTHSSVPAVDPSFRTDPYTSSPNVAGERPIEPGERIVGNDLNTNVDNSSGLNRDFVVDDNGPTAQRVEVADTLSDAKADRVDEVSSTDTSSDNGGSKNFEVDPPKNDSGGGSNNFQVDPDPAPTVSAPEPAAAPAYEPPAATPTYDPPAAPSYDSPAASPDPS